jgi:hypothetical protein
MNSDTHNDIRPGQRWRLRNGNEVMVHEVTGDGQVDCILHPAEIKEGLGPTGQVVGSAATGPLDRDAFAGAELLRPLFRASFGARVGGRGVDDRVMQALQAIASVESRGTPRVDTGTGVIHGDHAEYVVELAAPDEEAAKAVIANKLGEDLVSNIDIVEV